MRIVLIQGEPIFASGFRTIVTSCDDLQLAADAVDARSGFLCIDEQKPDIVVMDIFLSGMNGIAATREIHCRAAATRILLLAAWPRERDALDGLAAGASGFALKSEPPDVLLYAIRAVASGSVYLAPQLRGCSPGRRDARRVKTANVERDVLNMLSRREREVLDLVLKGWRNRDIAREMCISIKTVDTHRTRINRKLGCNSATELIRFAAINGLLPFAPSCASTDVDASDEPSGPVTSTL